MDTDPRPQDGGTPPGAPGDRTGSPNTDQAALVAWSAQPRCRRRFPHAALVQQARFSAAPFA